MKWLCRNLYRKEKGFTLVELMIVIIILAILTGIAIPSYMVLRDRARTSAAQSELKNVATALEMYNADNESYPDAENYAAMALLLEAGEYMDPVPLEDPWGEDYTYALDAAGSYTIASISGDGVTIIDGQLQEEE
jgi:general secretion pathway protein G